MELLIVVQLVIQLVLLAQDKPTCLTCKSHATVSSSVCTCDSGYYGTADSCTACDATCATCSGSATTCVTCKSHATVASNVCSCDSGYYGTADSCKACDSTCATCSGSGSSACVTCKDASNMNLSGGTCTCKTGYFDSATSTCVTSCDSTCATCSGSTTNCEACKDSTHMSGTLPGPFSCNAGYYWDSSKSTTICQTCDSTCVTCSGSGSSKCNSCKDNMSLSATPGTCTCKDGFSWDAASKSCKCSISGCATCSTTTYGNCDACQSGFKLSSDSKSCACSITNCKTCSTTTYGTCQECQSGFSWDATSQTCKCSVSLCDTCSTTTYGTCDKCKENAALATGACICSSNYYKDADSCKACTNQCITCTTATKCIAYVTGASLSTTDSTCSCNNGYYASSGKCIACPTSCSNVLQLQLAQGVKPMQDFPMVFVLANLACIWTLQMTVLLHAITFVLLVIDANDGKKCSTCITNAELTGTTCACTVNSAYDLTSNSCLCGSGYTLSNSKCVVCKKYLSPSDVISAAYSSSYTSITITPKVPVDITVDPTCSKTLIYDSFQKMGSGLVCSWTDSKNLKISLGSGFSIRSAFIDLDGTYILKDTKDTCTTNYQPLSATVSMGTNINPTAKLSGPSSVSLGCGSDPISYSAGKSSGSFGGNLTYTCSATMSPALSSLTSYIASTKASSSTVSIDRSLLTSISSAATLTVTVKVKNWLSDETSSASVTTSISTQQSLSVSFDAGTSILMKASDSKDVKAKVTSVCGGSTSAISWKWSYVSTPDNSKASSLAASTTTQKLSISKSMFTAGGPYSFTATASQDNDGTTVTGSATVSITVTSSPLYIELSKGNGQISSSKDYTINANKSKDPDDSTTSLIYAWTCANHEDGSECAGADNAVLLSNEIKSELTIPSARIVKGANWDITCTISKDTRTASLAITLTVLNVATASSIEIPAIATKANSQSKNKYSASVSSSADSKFEWSQKSGSSIDISPNNLPTLSIPSGSMADGMTYVFTLKITDSSGVSLSVDLSISVNLGASCQADPDISPSSGMTLIDTFLISITRYINLNNKNYPLLYTYKYYLNNSDTKYTIGSTTEENQISTKLSIGDQYVSAHVCDQLDTCNDYSSKVVSVSKYSPSRGLDTSSLMDAYMSMTLDPDNISSSITLFCSSATIDSSLFTKMWSDLQSYIKSQNDMTTTLLQSILKSAYSMTGQTDLMSISIYDKIITWLNSILTTFSTLYPSQDNMNTVVMIGESYLKYGNSTSFSDLTFEKSVLYINSFYLTWAAKATYEDLVTQSSLSGKQNTDNTMIYKERNFKADMENTTKTYANNRVLTYPSTLEFDEESIMNMRANFYIGYTDDVFSDIALFSFGNSGTYKDYTLTQADETEVPFSSSDYPFLIEQPFYKNVSEGMVWGCQYYNDTLGNWTDSSCKVAEINNTKQTITFKVYHFSMYRFTEINPSDNPPIYFPRASSSCDDSYAPIYILLVTLFIGLILAPIMVIIDRISHPQLTEAQAKNASHNSSSHSPIPSERTLMRHDISIHASQGEESVQSGESRSSDDEVVESQEIHLTENSIAQQVAGPTDGEKPEDEGKYELEELIEGHLTFGLFYYRSSFTRIARLFTLIVVIIFELLLEGLLYFGFEDIKSGNETATQTLFDDYEGNYFGCMILALAITIPIEIFMIVAFSIDRTKAPQWSAAAVTLGVAILIGSIVGIVMLSYDFCHKWSGYWAVSFLRGVLIEIFIMQTIYMIVRYFIIQAFPPVEESKSKA
ncbi:unnamed protein product [Blepharisma stoltei]|uniref:EGF-like domain-containing protein n=1 Tax=Blepharisma stoltei TaxID=1481888 RepID=A0AAU9J0C1_9CILI|nr:unnamed protein product [Blepharisma stoltei]